MEKFLGLQLEYLLMLQNFREVTHGAFDWILYHITLFLIHNNRMFMEDAFYCFIYYVSGNNILSIFS